MLQVTQNADETPDADEKTDDAIYCARCGHLVTRSRWHVALGGSGRVFTNPLGFTFRIACFASAPGAAAEGERTDDHTWFAGYFWNFALCKGCGEHLGWHYLRDAGGDKFFGLIKDKLADHPA